MATARQNWRDQGANADRRVARPDANPYPDTAGLGLRRQPRLAQLPLHDLAIGIARQRPRRQVDRLRHLVIREPLGAPRAQRLGADAAVAGHDHRMHALAQHRAGLCDDGALDDAGMSGKHGFDFGGIDLQAAAVDHVFLAIEYPHQIVRVDRTEIAGVPKAAGETLGRRLWIVPVSPDDRTAVNPDLADLAPRQLTALGIHHDDMRARTAQTDAVEVRSRQFRPHAGRRRGG